MIPILGKKCLLDTNVLVAYFNSGSLYHARACKLLEKVSKGEILGYISSQNILELASVLKSTYHVPNPSIAANVSILSHELTVVYPNLGTIEMFVSFLKEKDLHAMDLFLLATAKANGMDYFVTEDRHFKLVTEIKVYNPFLTA